MQIADFGMSRDLEDDSCYIVSGGKIPVKWTAPEVLLLYTIHGKFWWWKILANLANHELITNFFLTNIHRYTENVFGTYMHWLKLTYSPNFFLPIAFTCMICQNYPYQNFPVYGNHSVVSFYVLYNNFLI